jgi:hypothetical protein
MNTKNYKLKSCPFCGSDGYIKIESDHYGEYFDLGCSNQDCPAHFLFMDDPGDADEQTIENAVKYWNTRK